MILGISARAGALPRQRLVRGAYAFVAAGLLVAGLAGTASANKFSGHECFAKDRGNRIAACSELLNMPDLTDRERASAYSMRALALSLLNRYAEAIRDYDRAITLNPNFSVALNNRAWAYYRSGNVAKAWPDVRRSLQLDPWSGHAHDTRAHLLQSDGRPDEAYKDYVAAMRFGGKRMIELYQCGLQAQGHYNGPRNGILSESLLAALKVCVQSGKKCDPLPPDEECKVATS